MADYPAIAEPQHAAHMLEKKWNILQLIFTIGYLCLPIFGMKRGAGLRLEWEFEVEVMGLNYLPM